MTFTGQVWAYTAAAAALLRIAIDPSTHVAAFGIVTPTVQIRPKLTVAAFSRSSPLTHSIRLRSIGTALQASSSLSANDAITRLSTSQSESVKSILDAIPDLAAKPSLSWETDDGESIGGQPCTLDAYDAPGPANIAWLSDLTIDSRMSSLTVFNGPLTDVPHLLSRCVVLEQEDATTLRFDLDFRPRAYGAYEMKDAEGNYPGPEELGRDAFTFSGNRMEYAKKFGTEELVSFLESTVSSFEDAAAAVVDDAATEEEAAVLTRGPNLVSVTLPATESNIETIAAARSKAVEFWLGWALDKESHGHRPGAPINSQYVYDSKYRQNAYSALVPVYKGFFGDVDGLKLAAAESGPLDEGYVGGGS